MPDTNPYFLNLDASVQVKELFASLEGENMTLLKL